MRAFVYVDVFNFYYCAVKGTPYKWLNYLSLASRAFPKDEIAGVRYFTARLTPYPDDPLQPQRQETYLRALKTIPSLTIHEGRYLRHKARMRLVNPPKVGPQTCEVWKTEEKGSDVNLASYLLLDGIRGKYELAIVLTNDSDLVEPVRMVRDELGLKVAVLNPQRDKKKTSWSLKQVSTFYLRVRESALATCQFPDELRDDQGPFHKPPEW